MRLSTYLGLLVFATLIAAFAHADAGQQQLPPQQQQPMPQQPIGPVPPIAAPVLVPTGLFCTLFPVGDGTVAIVQNNEVELYRGFAANVQGVLIHYQRIGVCPQVL